MTAGVLCSGRKRVYRSAAIHLWRFSLAHAENGISWGAPPSFPRGAGNPGPVSAGPATAAASFSAGPAQRPSLPPTGRTSLGLRHRLLLRSVGKTLLARAFPSASPAAVRKPCSPSEEGCPIGCDIQWTGSAVDARGIADFFHPRERLALDALPPDDYARGFYRMWVRKEAVMKACGKGLGARVCDRVLVSAESGGRRASIQEALPDEGEHWWAPCAIGRDGYAVALAIPENEAPRPIIRHRLEIPFR